MNKREFLSLSGALPLMLAGCGSSSSGSAQIRLLNATVGYTTLDLTVNDASVTSGVAKGEVSAYTSVPDGSVTTVLVDKSSGTSSNLLTSTRTLTKDASYTIVAYGYAGNPKLVQMVESQAAPATGFANFSVLNTAYDVGSVDVYLTPDGNIATATAVAHNVTANPSQSAYTQVGTGTYVLTITAANNRADVRLQASGLVLAEGQTVSLVVVPGASGVLAQAYLLAYGATQPTTHAFIGTKARIRLVPALADGSGARLSVNGSIPAIIDLSSSPDIGGYVPVEVGTPSVTVNDVAVPLTLDTGLTSAVLVGGADYTVVVYNDATSGNPVAKLILDNNTRPLTATNFKFRLIHLIDNQADRDLTLQVASGVIANVHFGQASPYTETASPGATTALLLENVQTIFQQPVTTVSGYVYTMFAFDNNGTVVGDFWPDRGTT